MIAYFPMVISALIYQRFTTGGIAESRSIAFLMLIICMTLFFIIRYFTRKRGVDHDRS
jgi:molybdate/tungstate transport system permease protein